MEREGEEFDSCGCYRYLLLLQDSFRGKLRGWFIISTMWRPCCTRLLDSVCHRTIYTWWYTWCKWNNELPWKYVHCALSETVGKSSLPCCILFAISFCEPNTASKPFHWAVKLVKRGIRPCSATLYSTDDVNYKFFILVPHRRTSPPVSVSINLKIVKYICLLFGQFNAFKCLARTNIENIRRGKVWGNFDIHVATSWNPDSKLCGRNLFWFGVSIILSIRILIVSFLQIYFLTLRVLHNWIRIKRRKKIYTRLTWNK